MHAKTVHKVSNRSREVELLTSGTNEDVRPFEISVDMYFTECVSPRGRNVQCEHPPAIVHIIQLSKFCPVSPNSSRGNSSPTVSEYPRLLEQQAAHLHGHKKRPIARPVPFTVPCAVELRFMSVPPSLPSRCVAYSRSILGTGKFLSNFDPGEEKFSHTPGEPRPARAIVEGEATHRQEQ